MNFAAGNLCFMTESTLDITFLDGFSSGSLESQLPVTNTMAKDWAEVGKLTLLERVPGGIITIPMTRSE